MHVEGIALEKLARRFALIAFEQTVGFAVPARESRPQMMNPGPICELVRVAGIVSDCLNGSSCDRRFEQKRLADWCRLPSPDALPCSTLDRLDRDETTRRIDLSAAFLTIEFEPLTPARKPAACGATESSPSSSGIVANRGRIGEALKRSR